MKIFSGFFIACLKAYRWVISPALQSFGVQCRFEPSCSVYAIEAIQLHGPIRGGYLTTARLLRCSPLCKGGHDPVPRSWKGDSCHG